jgi:hypothetical protein
MKRAGRMLVLILCLAVSAGGVQVVAQEKQTDVGAKRVAEAEQSKAKRATEAAQQRSKRAAQRELFKAKHAADAERREAKRAVDRVRLAAKRKVQAEQLQKKLATAAKRKDIPLDGTFKLLSSRLNLEYVRGRLVKGAPYSATAVTEATQTLSDGNQIVQRNEVIHYRDSEGRTRIEQTLKKIGKWVAAGEPKRFIMIADPSAGHYYYLDPNERKATKAPLSYRVTKPRPPLQEVLQRQKLALTKQRQRLDEQRAKQKELFEKHWDKRRQALEEERPKPGQASQEEWTRRKQMLEEDRAKQKQRFDEQWVKQKQRFDKQLAEKSQALEGSLSQRNAQKSLTSPSGTASPEERRTAAATEPVKGKNTESLGRRIVEGVEAEGTRTTLTIPAGEIGNTLPIYVVDERWYSPELQMPVMTRHHDPRSGDTVFRLTNIRRAEPARSLFEVPPEYTIVENPRARFSTFPGAPKPGVLKIDTKPANPDLMKLQPRVTATSPKIQ